MTKNKAENEKTNLQKLLEKQAKLKQQIKLAQKKEEEKENQIFTQKCILVGALILNYIKNNGEFSEQILKILDSSIDSENDKTLLGLQPSPGSDSKDTMKSVQAQDVP